MEELREQTGNRSQVFRRGEGARTPGGRKQNVERRKKQKSNQTKSTEMKTKQIVRSMASVLMAASLFSGVAHFTIPARAQDGPPQGGGGPPPNFDPEEMRQRMMDSFREQLEVKDDGEWKIIADRIQKVQDARMAGGGRGGPGGPGGPGGGGRGPGGPGGFFRMMGGRGPEAQALRKAIDDKASAEVLKAKMAAVREARKQNEAKVQQAQDELKAVLTTQQEAVAMLMGLVR